MTHLSSPTAGALHRSSVQDIVLAGTKDGMMGAQLRVVMSGGPALTSGFPRACGDQSEVENLCKQGRLDEALLCLDQESTVPSHNMYRSVLQACMKKGALVESKWVHAHLAKHGFESSKFLCELVVVTLVKCGSLADGLKLFRRLSSRTAFSWTAIISGYSDAGLHREAISCYEQMQQDDVRPDKYALVSLLKACSRSEDLGAGLKIHAATVRHGLESDIFVGTTLVSMYAKCGSIRNAQKVFDRMSCRNVVSWNAMLAAYSQQDQAEEALQVYERLKVEGIRPDDRTFVSILQACGSLAEKEGREAMGMDNVKVKSLHLGKEIHAEAASLGFETDIFVGSALISMYAKCLSVVDAEKVFNGLSQRSVVSWNAMLAAYAQQDYGEQCLQMYVQMQGQGVKPDDRTFVSALQACGSLADKEESTLMWGQYFKVESLQKGKDLHADAVGRGFQADVFIGSALLSMYAKCGSIMDAQRVFDGQMQRNLVSWNAMLAAYAQQDQGENALDIYGRMMEEGVRPDARTFVSALQACGSLAVKEQSTVVDGGSVKAESLHKGKQIHAEAESMGFAANGFVANTLVSMYAKCGSMEDARGMFETLSDRDLVSWNAMLAAYAQDAGETALQAYSEMRRESVRPDARTFVSVLQACGILAETEEGVLVDGQNFKVETLRKAKEIHTDAIREGYYANVFVGSTLVATYSKCESIVDARHVFDGLEHRDVVSWTIMLAAYAEHDQAKEALQIYCEMQAQGVQADEGTFISILQACSNTGALDICIRTHQAILESECQLSLVLSTTLIHAYGKCGSMMDAEQVFDSLPERDIVSWNALMAGYARQGDYNTTMRCYQDMRLTGLTPTRVTYLALLSVCSHAGMVDQGLELFESMGRDHGICAELEHFVCVIDLVARAGLFSKVEELLASMPMVPSLHLWLCILSTCRKHGNVSLGREAFDNAVAEEPQEAAAYVLMSNIYAQAGMWESAMDIEELRRRAGAWKVPGQSWIEHEQEVHTFLVGDRRHEQEAVLHALLKELRAIPFHP